jgi:hypothetical protein
MALIMGAAFIWSMYKSTYSAAVTVFRSFAKLARSRTGPPRAWSNPLQPG